MLLLVLATTGDTKRIDHLLNHVAKETQRRSLEDPAAKERYATEGRGPVVEYLRTPHGESCLMRAAEHGQSAVLDVSLLLFFFYFF